MRRLCGISYRLAEDRIVRFDAAPRFPDQPPAPDPTGGRPTRFQVATGEIHFVSLPRRPRAAHRTHARRLPLLVCLLATAACNASEGTTVAAAADVAPGAAQPSNQAAPLELPGIEHYRRWSTRLGQGSQPGGDASFAALAQQGFRTILSVDGAMPDVDAAARHGLRYVHVPIGYDGIDPDEQLQIIKAATESEGPVYVHCHHGLHRGPAATAIARITIDGITHAEADQGLLDSGCSPAYAGLFRDVAAFVVPSEQALRAVRSPPAQVRPEGIRSTMVATDGLWGVLKDCKAAEWAPPAEHPDIQPAHEALMLREQLRELGRLDVARNKGEDFLARLAESERLAGELERLLREGGNPDAVDATYTSLKQSCSSCHADYRD